MNGMNGMNGGNMAGAGGGMPMPTPAGHQAELNYIYNMVEELSRQLADNRRVTEDIVNGLGRVRNRARSHGAANDEVIAGAADELNAEQESLDTLISILTESLEKAKHSRDANAALLGHYASAVSLMVKQLHEYKMRHVAEVASWHRSYREQLDDARRENSRLREQIWGMQAHASRANEQLRAFRGRYDDDGDDQKDKEGDDGDEGGAGAGAGGERWRRRVEEKAARQELRFWKRMAMPELDDDDPYWSDDDDVIDAAEKERLVMLEHEAAREQAEDSDDPQQQHHHHHHGQQGMQGMQTVGAMMGGIPMQREDSADHGMSMPPPRPLSAASSTGSTGPQ